MRLMLGLWLLMMIVIINAYTGVLTSLMVVPKLKPIPQSLQELAEMKEYKVTIQKNQILADAFLVCLKYNILHSYIIYFLLYLYNHHHFSFCRMLLLGHTRFWAILSVRILISFSRNFHKPSKMC